MTQMDKMLDDIGRLELCGLDIGVMKARVEKLRAVVNGGDGESLFMQYKDGRKRFRTTTKMLRGVEEQMKRVKEQIVELAMVEHKFFTVSEILHPSTSFINNSSKRAHPVILTIVLLSRSILIPLALDHNKIWIYEISAKPSFPVFSLFRSDRPGCVCCV